MAATGLLALSTQARAQALDQDRDGVDDRAVNFDDLDRRNRVLAAQSAGSFGCGTILPIIMNQLPTGLAVNPFLFEQVSLPIAH